MGSKLSPGRFDCYANALPEEPMFILLARDPLAPFLVRIWAALREGCPEVARGYFEQLEGAHGGTYPEFSESVDMIDEALDCAHWMATWRADRNGSWRTAAVDPPIPNT